MKGSGIFAVILLSGMVLVTAPLLAGFKRSEWPYYALIKTEGLLDEAVIEFFVTPEVFDLARGDLADLRVSRKDSKEAVGHVVIPAKGRTELVPLEVKLYNRKYISGKERSVTVDFGTKILKNRIEIVTPGANFRRSVLVEGSDDGVNWQKVREGVFLFRINDEGGKQVYDRREIKLPENDFRYLRVTVYNGPDDPEDFEINDVLAWCMIHEPAKIQPVPIRETDITQKGNSTELVFDLGFRNIPLEKIRLDFTDENFFRQVYVSGRNYKKRVIKVPVEEAPPREKTVEENWSNITSGAIYRYSSGKNIDESLEINLNGAKYRYLKVHIENLDNEPLNFKAAEVTRQIYRVALKAEHGEYALYFGNPKASRPQYDIQHYIDRLRSEGVFTATLGETASNPEFAVSEKKIPWSEQYRIILWLTLIIVLLLLTFLILRQIRSAPQNLE